MVLGELKGLVEAKNKQKNASSGIKNAKNALSGYPKVHDELCGAEGYILAFLKLATSGIMALSGYVPTSFTRFLLARTKRTKRIIQQKRFFFHLVDRILYSFKTVEMM